MSRLPRRIRLLTGAALSAVLLAALPSVLMAQLTQPLASITQPPGSSVRAAAASSANPLAGRNWGVYQGRGDQAWLPYVRATGTEKALLAKIALRPKAKWFGAWIPDDVIASKVRAYIANSTGGNPEVLTQLTVFRMRPWEHEACRRLPTAAEQASYRTWISRFASAIGDAHVAMILQPDGPFALCVPNRSELPLSMIAFAARRFAALPNTSVYIDAGASDWPEDDPTTAADLLMAAGIEAVRGFALNSTHYVSVASDIEFGTKVVAELARRGVPGRHFVINTAQNGRPFTWKQQRGTNFDHSPVCRSKADTRCVTLGIPPTADVANTRWGLSAANRERARAHVDGYLWFGRPWLYMQADPFVKSRAMQLVRTTPW